MKLLKKKKKKIIELNIDTIEINSLLNFKINNNSISFESKVVIPAKKKWNIQEIQL